MKRLLDINTWIALSVETHPQHAAARHWYAEAELVHGDLVFCRQTEIGFVRLITQQAVMGQCFAAPLTNAEAVEFLANVYKDPAVSQSSCVLFSVSPSGAGRACFSVELESCKRCCRARSRA